MWIRTTMIVSETIGDIALQMHAGSISWINSVTGNDEPYIEKVGQVTWTSDNHQTLSIQIMGSRWDTYLARGGRSPGRSQEGFDENRTTSRDDNIGCYQYGSRHHIRKAMVDATQPKNRLENEPSRYDELQVQRH